MENYLVMDIETRYLSDEVPGGWNNISSFGVAVVGVTHVCNKDEVFICYVDGKVFPMDDWEKAGKFESRIFDVAHLIDSLYQSPCIVTFNGIRFDYEVLRPYGFNPSIVQGTTYDILREMQKVLGHRVSLDSVAQATLGVGKSGSGKDAPLWFRDGQIEKVIEYCKADVEITKEIYKQILKHECVYYFDRAGRRKKCTLKVKT